MLKKLLALLLLLSVPAFAASGPYSGGGPFNGNGGGSGGGGGSAPDVSNATGILPVANGGTASTSLGNSLTNAGGVLDTTQCIGRTIITGPDPLRVGDNGCITTYNSASAIGATLVSASSTGFTSGWGTYLKNIGAGTLTVTPTGSTINGSSTFAVPANTGCYVYSDGTNYQLNYGECSALNGVSAQSAYTVLANNTGSTAAPVGSTRLTLGTPSITDTGVATQFTSSVAGYYQSIWQNTSNGATSSTDLILNNDSGTTTTHYIDLGINSSGFTGTGSINLANAAYLYSQTGDLVLGTGTANGIHFIINSGATDAMSIGTSGVVTIGSAAIGPIVHSGAETWTTGLGAITHYAGPSDQALAIAATLPATAAAGNAVTITASNAGTASFGNSFAGGNIVFTAGNGTANSANNGGAGGTISFISGAASTGFATGGGLSWTGGVGGALGSSQNGAGGGLSFTAGAGAAGAATGFNGGLGGSFSMTGGVGGTQIGTTNPGGIGGGFTLTSGIGGAATNTAGGTGGSGGPISLVGSAGGAATGASGTRTGGAGSSLILTTGIGGTGASANGAAGTLTVNIGGTGHPYLFIGSTGFVGVGGTVTPISTLDVGGGLSVGRRAIADANVTVTASDYIIAYTSITAARTVSVPCASLGSAGHAQMFLVRDESGSAGSLNTITLTATSGAFDQTSVILTAKGSLKFYADGANCYIVP